MSEQNQGFLPSLALLLDDDSLMLDILEEMLHQVGVSQVLKHLDAKRALQDLQARVPDLLICDLSIPDTDGIEFLDKVALLEYKGGVILHSGMDHGVIRAAGLLAKRHGLNVLGSYQKPMDMDSLRQALAKMSAPQ